MVRSGRMTVTGVAHVAVRVAVTKTIAMATVTDVTGVTEVTGVATAAVVAVGAESHHPHGGETDAAKEEE